MTACSTYGIWYFSVVAVLCMAAAWVSYYNTQSKNRCFVNSMFWFGIIHGLIAIGLYLLRPKIEGFRMMVRPGGTRDRSYRPYIQQEEDARYMSLYNPYKPFNAGLYSENPRDRDIKSFKTHFKQTQASNERW